MGFHCQGSVRILQNDDVNSLFVFGRVEELEGHLLRRRQERPRLLHSLQRHCSVVWSVGQRHRAPEKAIEYMAGGMLASSYSQRQRRL